MAQPLLTIAIPTYNRAHLLDKCLSAMLSQINDDIKAEIELIVSDNHSKDNTTDIVNKYIDQGFAIRYYKNSENVGPDRNIGGCFLKATSKYVWIFSDDDFILPGYLKFIFDLVKKNDLGNIYINALPYRTESDLPIKQPTAINYTTYNDPIQFVEKVNYNSTFITGNIINKSLIDNLEYIPEFYDSFLVQLSWIMPVIFAGKPNVIIDDQLVACLIDNTGGYKLYKVFGVNLNKILDQLIAKKLVDRRAKVIINKHLLSGFFPMFLYNKNFEQENPLKILIPVYWPYPYFWRKIFPALLKKYIKNKWLK